MGEGLSGVVRAATHRIRGHKVAVKTLATRVWTVKKVELLLNEVDIYLRLDHPNICRLLEVYIPTSKQPEAVHLAMELCRGQSLTARLQECTKYTETEAVEAVRQMFAVVCYCHSHGICHRDLKTENFVYADESASRLKLIDFGLSKHYRTGLQAQVGTIYFVAPEVLNGPGYTELCDIWSLGMITYVLLAGNFPFDQNLSDGKIAEALCAGCFEFPES